MKNAPNSSKKVCALCFGTNTELVKIGKYVYARPCKHDRETPQLTLGEKSEPQRQEAA